MKEKNVEDYLRLKKSVNSDLLSDVNEINVEDYYRLLTSVNKDCTKEEQLTEEDGLRKRIQRESTPNCLTNQDTVLCLFILLQ